MAINDSQMISVCNYSDNLVSFETHLNKQGYLFEPSIDGQQPFVIPMSFSEVRGVNQQSNIFREGFLRFNPEEEKEVYEALGISNWESIMTDKDIRNIILKPTKAGLERLINIMDSAAFERVRGMLIQLENTGMYDISGRVKEVVMARYAELVHKKKRISEIQIVPTQAEINEEQEQKLNEDLLEKMKAEIEAKLRAEFEEKLKSELSKSKRGNKKDEDKTIESTEVVENKE